MLRYLPAIAIGRIVRFAIRLVRKGGGSALPGLVLSKIAPGVLFRALESFDHGLVIITGSAGKSTTTKMLVQIVESHGVSVFTNPSTANILQGFYSAIIERADSSGRIPAEIAILEVDEAHAAALVRKVQPRQVTILNVMEDQLDRFVDPSFVRDDLAFVASRAADAVVMNADDQNTLLIGRDTSISAKVSWFGLAADVVAAHGSGLSTAPTFQEQIERPAVSSEITNMSGNAIAISTNGAEIMTSIPAKGLHYAVDAVAAFESARVLLGEGFILDQAKRALDEVPPVFARGEIVQINSEDVEFVLVQNPGSMQLNLDALDPEIEQLMFAIGRDVHDPSWMWTVNYQNLKSVQVCSGYNAFEAALVLAYNGVAVSIVTDDLEQATAEFFALPRPKQGRKTVVFSADAMRRMRRNLGFWSSDEVQR